MGSNNKKKHKKNKERTPIDSEELNIAENEQESIEDSVGSSQNDDDLEGTKLQKRVRLDDNSDSDTEPKKKKKKKKPVAVEESGPDKNKKSRRQLKRERFAERQAEMLAVSKDNLKSQCLSYLSQWKHDKSNWKFMKSKQTWLFKNKFSQNLVPCESWPLLMEYFESAVGNIRKMLLEDANKVITQMDDWTESQDRGNDEETKEDEDAAEIKKPDEIVYKRARDLIQCLAE